MTFPLVVFPVARILDREFSIARGNSTVTHKYLLAAPQCHTSTGHGGTGRVRPPAILEHTSAPPPHKTRFPQEKFLWRGESQMFDRLHLMKALFCTPIS